MSSELTVTWYGWGTYRVAGSTTLVVDPCVSSLNDEPHAPPDLTADAMLLTHGHHEHVKDARRFDLDALAPPQVARWLPCGAIEPDETREFHGVSVTARAFPHLEKHDVAGKLRILWRNRAFPRRLDRVIAAAWAIRGQPDDGPYLAYDLRLDGKRVFLTVEAFTELLDGDVAEAWGEGGVDLAIVGVESGQERAASELARRLGARLTVGAAVHAGFERFYGKPPVRGFAYPMLRPGESIRV